MWVCGKPSPSAFSPAAALADRKRQAVPITRPARPRRAGKAAPLQITKLTLFDASSRKAGGVYRYQRIPDCGKNQRTTARCRCPRPRVCKPDEQATTWPRGKYTPAKSVPTPDLGAGRPRRAQQGRRVRWNGADLGAEANLAKALDLPATALRRAVPPLKRVLRVIRGQPKAAFDPTQAHRTDRLRADRGPQQLIRAARPSRGRAFHRGQGQCRRLWTCDGRKSVQQVPLDAHGVPDRAVRQGAGRSAAWRHQDRHLGPLQHRPAATARRSSRISGADPAAVNKARSRAAGGTALAVYRRSEDARHQGTDKRRRGGQMSGSGPTTASRPAASMSSTDTARVPYLYPLAHQTR